MKRTGTGHGEWGPGEVWGALGGQDGFTMVELLVAVLMIVLTALATFSLLDVGTRTTFRAEESQAMLNVAQRELEELRGVDYDKLALTSPPGTDTNPAHPWNRVDGTTFDLAGDGSDPAELVVDELSGGVDAVTPDVPVGDIKVDIYRFVVWRDDPGCVLICPGSEDYKRAVVAVRVDTGSTLSANPGYEELASNFIDPEHSAADTDVTGIVGEIVTGQQFYLSDTRCQALAGDPLHESPTDHQTHNTTGTCGGTRKPDALIAGATPLDPTFPPLRDYATELELTSDPNCQPPIDPDPPENDCYKGDAGLQLKRPASNGCNYAPGGTDEHQLVHRWVSQTMPISFKLTGKATLELFTRTIEDLSASGKICVYMFTRTLDLLGAPQDTLIADTSNPTNSFFTYTDPSWPKGGWEPIKLQMSFAETDVGIGDRIGLAISIERSETTPDILQFAYDHIDYESRIEVLTTTPLG